MPGSRSYLLPGGETSTILSVIRGSSDGIIEAPVGLSVVLYRGLGAPLIVASAPTVNLHDTSQYNDASVYSLHFVTLA